MEQPVCGKYPLNIFILSDWAFNLIKYLFNLMLSILLLFDLVLFQVCNLIWNETLQREEVTEKEGEGGRRSGGTGAK